jgi:hypothetical protein
VLVLGGGTPFVACPFIVGTVRASAAFAIMPSDEKAPWATMVSLRVMVAAGIVPCSMAGDNVEGRRPTTMAMGEDRI